MEKEKKVSYENKHILSMIKQTIKLVICKPLEFSFRGKEKNREYTGCILSWVYNWVHNFLYVLNDDEQVILAQYEVIIYDDHRIARSSQ